MEDVVIKTFQTSFYTTFYCRGHKKGQLIEYLSTFLPSQKEEKTQEFLEHNFLKVGQTSGRSRGGGGGKGDP